MHVTVLGAGAWGTALAASAARRHPTRLWARDAEQAAAMRTLRCNARYLPGIELPQALAVTADFDAAVAHAAGGAAPDGGLIVVATPMAGLEDVLRRLPVDGRCGVTWLCKGFQQTTGRLGHEVARAACPAARVGVISGPSFAVEVARGQPTALVAASADAEIGRASCRERV